MNPRIGDLDIEWATSVKAFCRRAVSESKAEMVPDGSQVEWVMFAGYLYDLAFVEYALGEPTESVRHGLSEAAGALKRVFELRGSSPGIPILRPGGGPAEAKPVDYSLTNSTRGLFAMYLALISLDLVLAREIAALLGDPPDASYLGEHSTVCTPEDQELAAFLKAVLLEQTPEMLARTASSSDGRAFERIMLESLWTGNAPFFVDALPRLLDRHALEAHADEHRRDPTWLICVPALALASLAVMRGLVAPRELPDGPYFPARDFLALSRVGGA